MAEVTQAGDGATSTTEQWLNANHMRVMVDGQWEDVRLMPLADHLCESEHPFFRRYCN